MKHFELSELNTRVIRNDAHHVKVKVIGIGGLGCDLMSYAIKECTLVGVDVYSIDSDLDTLSKSISPYKIQIQKTLTNTIDVESEAYNRIIKEFKDTDIVLIYTALGGAIGSSATTEIIKILKELGIYCVTIASVPSNLESSKKQIAQKSLKSIKEYADTYIVLDNDKVLENPILGNMHEESIETINYLSEFIVNIIVDEVRFEKVDTTNNKVYYRRVCDSDFSYLINELKNDNEFFITQVNGIEFQCKGY